MASASPILQNETSTIALAPAAALVDKNTIQCSPRARRRDAGAIELHAPVAVRRTV